VRLVANANKEVISISRSFYLEWREPSGNGRLGVFGRDSLGRKEFSFLFETLDLSYRSKAGGVAPLARVARPWFAWASP
jgi:hypothetical protein